MKQDRKVVIAASVFVVAILAGAWVVSEAQETQGRVAHANGVGSLKIGDEQFKISSAIVRLDPDHKAEVTLISDITIFVSGTWSAQRESQTEIELQITGGASAGGLEGTGKASLTPDGKSLLRLTLKGVSRTTKRKVQAEFKSN